MDIKKLEQTCERIIQFEKRGGLVPVITQDSGSKDILMLAYANREALDKTIQTNYATFWSTSKNKLWTKGENSGNKLRIENILVDCDQDALVYQVTSEGDGACHTVDELGKHRESCFYRKIARAGVDYL
ncbi:phosphoribosyl-AMP cyclohydrolase [Candidatus Peregrinibacteria bacterium]|nr:phosphoribosyl-AMP cyclohydrolase [Candidatus Peregrinibacteria bacterium]